jgi:CheY-like chemotaxis protein
MAGCASTSDRWAAPPIHAFFAKAVPIALQPASALARRALRLESDHMAIKDSIDRSSSCRSRSAPKLIDLTGIRILLVDDDLEQLELVSELLAEANADVMTATSADEAIEQLAQCAPDVIVSDINMPGCDGYHLLRRVRSRNLQEGGATPAIALTGKTTTEDQTRALLSGYQMHVPKPFRVIELLVAIRNVVKDQSGP